MSGIWWQLGVPGVLAVVLGAAVPVVVRLRSSAGSVRPVPDPRQQRIVDGVSEVAERSVSDVLRPRPDVVTVDVTADCAEARELLVAAGHSRAPVVADGSLDDVVGIVHLRDLTAPPEPCTAGDLATVATVFPETLSALDALRQLQRVHVQMAVVVNEHGGVEGIVTVADLVDELVGEIFEEADREAPMLHRDPDGSVLLPGRFPVHDLPDLGIEVPEGQYATLAGYLLWRLQRIPDGPGDGVEVDGWQLTVTRVEGRAITGVRVTRPERSPAADVDDTHTDDDPRTDAGTAGSAAVEAGTETGTPTDQTANR